MSLIDEAHTVVVADQERSSSNISNNRPRCRPHDGRQHHRFSLTNNMLLHKPSHHQQYYYGKNYVLGATTTDLHSPLLESTVDLPPHTQNSTSVQSPPIIKLHQQILESVVIPANISVDRSNPDEITIVRKWKVPNGACECGCSIYMWTFNSLTCLFLNYVIMVTSNVWAICLAIPANTLLLWMLYDLYTTSFCLCNSTIVSVTRKGIQATEHRRCLYCYEEPETQHFPLRCDSLNTQATVDDCCEPGEIQNSESNGSDVYDSLCLIEKATPPMIKGDLLPLTSLSPPNVIRSLCSTHDEATFFAQEIDAFLRRATAIESRPVSIMIV